jgi:hypothetical protein
MLGRCMTRGNLDQAKRNKRWAFRHRLSPKRMLQVSTGLGITGISAIKKTIPHQNYGEPGSPQDRWGNSYAAFQMKVRDLKISIDQLLGPRFEMKQCD